MSYIILFDIQWEKCLRAFLFFLMSNILFSRIFHRQSIHSDTRWELSPTGLQDYLGFPSYIQILQVLPAVRWDTSGISQGDSSAQLSVPWNSPTLMCMSRHKFAHFLFNFLKAACSCSSNLTSLCSSRSRATFPFEQYFLGLWLWYLLGLQ